MMVELLQNVCNHGAIPSGAGQGIPGVLVITTENTGCSVMAGNYISKDKIAKLSAKIDKANSCAFSELEAVYQEEMMKDQEPGQKGAGLGFIDMRMKSSNKIDYSLVDFDSNFSFLSISVSIPF